MLTTQKDLLEMLDTNQIDPSNLPSRRLSQSQVIIEIENKRKFDIMNGPFGYEYDGIIDSLLTSFTLSNYCNHIQIHEKGKRNAAIKSFFHYVSENDKTWTKQTSTKHNDPLRKELPVTCVQGWFLYLKDTDTPGSCWRKMTNILKTLTFTLQKRYGKFKHWPIDQKKIYEEFKILIPKNPRGEKFPPLGKYLGLPPDLFTNRELLMGLRYGVIWLLRKLHDRRKIFLSQPKIADAFQHFKNRTAAEFRREFSHWDSRTIRAEKHSEKWIYISSSCWKVISDDPLLCEWQCYCWNELQNTLNPTEKRIKLTKEFQHNFISSFSEVFRASKPGLMSSTINFPGWEVMKPHFANHVSLRRPCMWGIDWYVHTGLEVTLMSWLLSTERAQTSGIIDLVFDNVHISDVTPNTLQISTKKLRRTSNTKKTSSFVQSTIYRKNDPPFSIYKHWLEREVQLHEHLTDYNVDQKYIYGPHNLIKGEICQPAYKRLSAGMRPLELLSIAGTVWQTTFLSETPESGMREAQAFIAILKNRVEKKHNFPHLRINLPSSAIGQSLVVEQQRFTNKQSSFGAVESEVLGHSESTGRDIYKKGFYKIGVAEIVGPVRDFARRVGDEKFILANSIADRLKNSQRKISLLELEKICGINSTKSEQADLLEHLDVHDMLSISGAILDGSEVLIVETEITAGMIWSYIKHIESNLPALLASPREQKSIEFLAKLINLHHIFEGFQMKLQQAGKVLAEESDFCFPPII